MDRRSIIVAIFVLSFTSLGILSENQPQTNRTKGTSADTEKQTEDHFPVIQHQQNTPSNQQPAKPDTSNQDAEFSQKVVIWSAAVQAAMAVIVAAFTGVLLWYSHRGWQVAKQSADTAKDSLIIGERAYLTIEKFRVLLNYGQTPTFEYNIVNTGRTPAILINTQHGFTFSKSLPEAPVFTDEMKNIPVSIPSGKDLQIVSEPDEKIIFTEQLHSQLNRKDIFIYFWLLVTYRDVFKETRHVAFGTRYNIETLKCRAIESPKYNYSD
jgi:hypothetical protein